MTVDGARNEPAGLAFARRLPGPPVARASLPWAVLAAFGAGLFASAIVTTVLSLLLRLAGLGTGGPVLDLVSALATGVAVAVAWAAGGRTAVTGYIAILALERLLGLPGILAFCGRNPEFCSLLEYLANVWPIVLGLVIGYALVRWVVWVRPRDGDRNEVLEAAGALAVTQTLLARAAGGSSVTATQFVSELTFLMVAVVAGLACAAVLLRRVDPARRWRTLGIVALAVVVPWLLVSVPQLLETVGVGRGIAISGLALVGFAAPLIEVAAAALVLYIAAARAVTAQR